MEACEIECLAMPKLIKFSSSTNSSSASERDETQWRIKLYQMIYHYVNSMKIEIWVCNWHWKNIKEYLKRASQSSWTFKYSANEKKLNILRIKLKIRMLNFVTCFCVPQIKGLSWLMKYARINLCSNYSRQRDVTMEIKRACLLVWWTLLLAFFAIYTCHDINHFALKFIESSQFFVIACNEIFVLFKFNQF